ncbi:hypothetical protein LCGC14_2681570, partial [marine sediment metagenome]
MKQDMLQDNFVLGISYIVLRKNASRNTIYARFKR